MKGLDARLDAGVLFITAFLADFLLRTLVLASSSQITLAIIVLGRFWLDRRIGFTASGNV